MWEKLVENMASKVKIFCLMVPPSVTCNAAQRSRGEHSASTAFPEAEAERQAAREDSLGEVP